MDNRGEKASELMCLEHINGVQSSIHQQINRINERFTWIQTLDDLIINVPVPNYDSGKQMEVNYDESTLSLGINVRFYMFNKEVGSRTYHYRGLL